MQDCFSNLQPECVGFGILTPFPLTFELPLCPQIQVPLPSVHPPPLLSSSLALVLKILVLRVPTDLC